MGVDGAVEHMLLLPGKALVMNAGWDRNSAGRKGSDAPAGGSKSLWPAALCGIFTEDVWEEYALGMRSEEDCRPLEEHLLTCPACQDLLAEIDEYVRVAKAALSQRRGKLFKPMSEALALSLPFLLFRLP
jgi:hypothetical protein